MLHNILKVHRTAFKSVSLICWLQYVVSLCRLCCIYASALSTMADNGVLTLVAAICGSYRADVARRRSVPSQWVLYYLIPLFGAWMKIAAMMSLPVHLLLNVASARIPQISNYSVR